MEENGALLRRMTASGHTVGILLDGAAGSPEELLKRAEDALYRATLGRTRLICLRNADERTAQTLKQAGYCPLSPDLDRSSYKLESASNAASPSEADHQPAGRRLRLAGSYGFRRRSAGIRCRSPGRPDTTAVP